ncbi:hypothetical protein EB796_003350 [Bugula neritina]|uniref:p53 tetramerisation domain-containing protein n=1 Tax=Bugula neritina TaxID=10212 RepID=A0A7J7KJA3_BUGNE|nr:hypothetical protein EB796_003350 [Bugula neritina]
MYGIMRGPRDESREETFTLRVKGRRNYEVLAMLRDALETSSRLNQRPRNELQVVVVVVCYGCIFHNIVTIMHALQQGMEYIF